MTANTPKAPVKGKGIKSERQLRLSTALRENLRKRKIQSQEREKSKLSHEESAKE
jgi:hypothetical protein